MMEQIVAKVSQDRDAIALMSQWKAISEEDREISEEEIKQAIADLTENSEPFRNILSDLDKKKLLTLVLASITNWSPSFLDNLLGESGFDLSLKNLQNEIWLKPTNCGNGNGMLWSITFWHWITSAIISKFKTPTICLSIS